jgi:hypothetical protein
MCVTCIFLCLTLQILLIAIEHQMLQMLKNENNRELNT